MTQFEIMRAAICPSVSWLLQNHTKSYNAIKQMINDKVFLDVCMSLELKIYNSTMPIRHARATKEII